MTLRCLLAVAILALIAWLTAFPLVAQITPGGAPDASQFVGAPQGPALSGAALDQKTSETAGLLRCPVCQGLSIGDSPSAMAVNMKEQVRELLARGYTQQQILEYFERAYGQFVLLKPKLQGVNWLVWGLPIAALLIGGLLVFFATKRLEAGKRNHVPVGDATSVTAAADAELERYILRVRELAYGWPGGVDPASKENA
jgi:cytochrome c-type biogenesis protein CcmH/NrfF